MGPSRKRGFSIREAHTAAEGHSRAEQQVWEAMWVQGSEGEGPWRLIQIGLLGLARLANLSESNARLNLRSLVKKLAVEEHAGYVCEQSQGRTYRVYEAAEVLRRRREAGLIWYAKRTLAVVFVDPQSGEAVLSKRD